MVSLFHRLLLFWDLWFFELVDCVLNRFDWLSLTMLGLGWGEIPTFCFDTCFSCGLYWLQLCSFFFGHSYIWTTLYISFLHSFFMFIYFTIKSFWFSNMLTISFLAWGDRPGFLNCIALLASCDRREDVQTSLSTPFYGALFGLPSSYLNYSWI